MTFGSKLRAARKEKKLTQKELASMIKAAHNSISNWENDQNMPDPDTIQHLCWALNVEPNYFFSADISGAASSLSPSTTQGLILSDAEKLLIQKYRRLDARGRSAVMNVLDHELATTARGEAGPSAKQA